MLPNKPSSRADKCLSKKTFNRTHSYTNHQRTKGNLMKTIDKIQARSKIQKCQRIEPKSVAQNSTNTRICVAIRLRPLSASEKKDDTQCVWNVQDTNTLNQTTKYASTSHHFEYVCALNTGTTLDLYNAVSKRVVLSSCKGIHGTIIAYGQTSSGKTHTMLGTDHDPGIIRLSLSDIFHHITKDSQRKYSLFISYIEIHNESINDLLNKQNQNLRVIDTPRGNQLIKNCTRQAVQSTEQALHLLAKGECLRNTSETYSNAKSSRSHTIFRITIQSQSTNNKRSKTLRSVLNLVDLAGSESNTHIYNENKTQVKEAKYINQSLLCLQRVILSLSSKRKNGYIPYRGSKLTRILQQSLGGNTNTTVICTLSPTLKCVQESMNTLRFAQFTKKVTNHVVVNEAVDDKEQLRKYQQLVKALKEKINEYSQKDNKMNTLQEENLSLKKQIEKQKRDNIKLETQLKHFKQRLSMNKERNPLLLTACSTPLSEDGSERSSAMSLSIQMQNTELKGIVTNLQNKLEQVQGNIEMLTRKISETQFIDFNSVVSANRIKYALDDIKGVDEQDLVYGFAIALFVVLSLLLL
eukprot:419654_1